MRVVGQEKNESLRAAAAMASKGGTANEARLQDRESYIASLQARSACRRTWRPMLLQQCSRERAKTMRTTSIRSFMRALRSRCCPTAYLSPSCVTMGQPPAMPHLRLLHH